MKLRLDLLEHLTDEDILEEVLANNHRYKPEPLFSKTGVGSLSSASIEERAQEEARSTARIQRAMQRLKQSGGNGKPQVRSLAETIEFLRQCHRRAPFLFFNGNTFADVGRTVVDSIFADLPTGAAAKSCPPSPITSPACCRGKRWSGSSNPCPKPPTGNRATA